MLTSFVQFGQDRTDYRSQYGYVITWYGAPIIWTSKKHQHVGESSAEDEYMAMNHAAKHTVWPRHLLEEMGLQKPVSEPTILLGDNQQAGKWSREDMVTSGNRFIERQYYKVFSFGYTQSRFSNDTHYWQPVRALDLVPVLVVQSRCTRPDT